jgi:hypothetical protein
LRGDGGFSAALNFLTHFGHIERRNLSRLGLALDLGQSRFGHRQVLLSHLGLLDRHLPIPILDGTSEIEILPFLVDMDLGQWPGKFGLLKLGELLIHYKAAQQVPLSTGEYLLVLPVKQSITRNERMGSLVGAIAIAAADAAMDLEAPGMSNLDLAAFKIFARACTRSVPVARSSGCVNSIRASTSQIVRGSVRADCALNELES